MEHIKVEIAVTAAALVVDDGMDYGSAKRQAVKQLGLPAKTPMPSNDELEAAVREHIALFCADTQPRELAALRQLALKWMLRMQDFRPYLSGSVWHGTATRHADIYIQLFCDDSKAAEIMLIDRKVVFEAHVADGFRGQPVSVLSLMSDCADLGEKVGVHLMVHDFDDLRGALRVDSQGRVPRGSLDAVRQLTQVAAHV